MIYRKFNKFIILKNKKKNIFLFLFISSLILKYKNDHQAIEYTTQWHQTLC